MNTTASTPYLARRGLRDVIEVFQTKQRNFYKMYTREERTNYIAETKQQFSGLGNARAMSEGSRLQWDTVSAPYKKEFVLQVYALGFKASKQTFKYDPYSIMSKHQQWMARGHYMALEIAGASIMANATSSSYLGIDGVCFASASHPTSSGTSLSNYMTGALSETNLSAAWINLTAQVDYRDRPWMVTNGHKLLIPRQLEITAKKILQTVALPFSADNTKNVIRENIEFTPGNPFFPSATAYALVPASDDENPLFLLRGGGIDTETDFGIDDWSMKIGAAQEFVYGWDFIQGTMYSTGA